ncbi:site-specific DNA-methyltransferase [Halarcobacter sp.]|uniref:site-specific DNA-methyltransferase n=1 Tax=Halarcobacter sp. TaxID=2321133 RepID=UPI003AFFCED7
MGKYDNLSKEELIELLLKRDVERKFGLVWERNQIEHDNALNNDYVFMDFVHELSTGEGIYDNLIIEGDNFDALRYLNLTHKGKIKCIYIDPPYNTGNKDFVYNDHYIKEDDAYRHSTWLEFLYRRLLLSRDLLREDGVLLVSINDENRSKLELLLDEIFPGMKAGSFVWRTRTAENRNKDDNLSTTHEHVLIYRNDGFKFRGMERTFSQYRNPDNDPKGEWRSYPITVPATYEERPNQFYPIYDKKAKIYYPPNPNRVWAYSPQSMETISEKLIFPKEPKVSYWHTLDELLHAIENNEVPTTNNGTKKIWKDMPNIERYIGVKVGWNVIDMKKYKYEIKEKYQPISSWIRNKSEEEYNEEIGQLSSQMTQQGSKLLQDILEKKAFQFAKPLSLLEALIEQSTEKGDIILDFFAGSATTAHAVLKQNLVDEGNRKFIMVSSTEATEKEPDKNICQSITAERVRRVITGYSNILGTGGNFAYLRAKRINQEDIYVDLQHPQIWTALELIHFDKLTGDVNHKLFYEQSNKFKRIIYLPEINESSLEALLILLAKDTISTLIYSWQPAIIKQYIHSEHVSIEQIPDHLIERFGVII